MSTPATPPEPVPAAAVILLRDGAGGLEVLMQRRREQATAFAGVVAFPGGKVAPIDSDPAFAAAADLGAPEPFPHARQLAALRELFEECAILLARAEAQPNVLAAREALLDERDRLDHNPDLWPSVLAERRLRLAGDALVPWARWVTPAIAPRRFDSTLFVAAAPPGQNPIGGRESEEYLWAHPADLLAAADREELYLVFVTRMNLMRLALCESVAAALDAARRGPHPTIQPQRMMMPEGDMMVIPAETPYPVRMLSYATSSMAVEAARQGRAGKKA
jgi:8-oxo-dGTP pyrophosphatase MutT (NUDIX family)